MDFLLFSATAAGYLFYVKQTKKDVVEQANKDVEDCKNPELAALVHKCPSLVEPLSKAPILGLLFGASWCDDCWDVVPLIEKVARLPKNSIVEIVYISSDRSEQEMIQYKPDIFSAVPYSNVEERANLKRHFGVCAKKEMEELKMTQETRKHGTPTLILLDATTGRVLTEKGVDDVANQNPFEVLKTWNALL